MRNYFAFLKLISILVCFWFFPTYATTFNVHTVGSNFELKSPAFLQGKKIPMEYTCDGQNISPELSWINAPNNTRSFVIMLIDPDAPKGLFYHWVLYNIPASTSFLPKNTQTLPAGTNLGKNSLGKFQYEGPCPPKGSYHRYIFRIYALDSQLKLAEEERSILFLFKTMQNHILATTEIIGGYTR